MLFRLIKKALNEGKIEIFKLRYIYIIKNDILRKNPSNLLRFYLDKSFFKSWKISATWKLRQKEPLLRPQILWGPVDGPGSNSFKKLWH